MQKLIIFRSKEINAILAGRKTQTRRVVKPQPELYGDGFMIPLPSDCPLGYIGDQLTAQETFAYTIGNQSSDFSLIAYNAINKSSEKIKWKPSIHMPREANRITLEITEVKIQRLQDITGSDIQAEGFCTPPEHQENYKEYLIKEWVKFWDSTNKNHPWDSNPWVWVIEFKVT